MTLDEQVKENKTTREALVEEYGEDEVRGAEKFVRDDRAEEIGEAMGIDPELLKAYASNPADVGRLANLIGEDRAAFLISHSEANPTPGVSPYAGPYAPALTQDEVGKLPMEDYMRWRNAGAHLKEDEPLPETPEEANKREATEQEMGRMGNMSMASYAKMVKARDKTKS